MTQLCRARGWLTLAMILYVGCAFTEGRSSEDGPGPDSVVTDPGDDPDATACVGDGSEGQACEVTADCDAPLVCLSGSCIAPEDPDVRCDPIEGIECAGEGEICVAGVCVVDPRVPGQDECVDPGPGPELAGTWAMRSTLHLREGLPGVVAGFLDVSEILADFVEGTVDLGLPGPVNVLIGNLIKSIIDQYVPNWAQELVLILAGFSDVLDDLRIDSTVVLVGQVCDATYRGSSTWDWISFEYRGTVITARPEDIAEIGPVTPEDFGARYWCGDLYIDRHRVHNALSGLVRWMVDTLVEITTGYPSVEQAIDAAIDCPGIAAAVNQAWQSACGCNTDIGPGIEAACAGYKGDMVAVLTEALDEAAIRLAVLSLEGVAVIPDAQRMIDGVWYGSLVGGDFPGTFDADR
jgi:hypothetical protein